MNWDDKMDPAVITVEEILNRSRPVLLITHDEGLGGHGCWHMLDGRDVAQRKAVAVPKELVVKIDPSILDAIDIPVGWHAHRFSPSEAWIKEPDPNYERSKKALNFGAQLTAEADEFLGEATREFNAKQRSLGDQWRFTCYKQWSYDPAEGLLKLEYADGSQLLADGQLLGTYCISDRSFEWAWNNPRFSSAITRDSRLVKALGERFDISYLQAGMIPVPDDVYLSFICAIGLKATHSVGMFRGREGDVHPIIMVKNLRWA
jgi:hypothetical protein